MESRHFAFNVARPLFANGDDKQSSVDLSTAVQHGHHRQDSKRNHRESELISFFLRAVEQKGGAAGLGQENWRARSRDNFTWQTQAISLRAHDMPPLWSTKFYICFVFGYLFVQKKSYPGRDKKQSKQKHALKTPLWRVSFHQGGKKSGVNVTSIFAFFSSCTVYPASELQPRVKSFSPCFYEAHTACHIPRTQQAGEKHQVPRMQIQVSGRRLSNAAFIQSPRYISYIKNPNILPD